MLVELLDLELKELPFQQWGPWRNHWGYETVVAEFDDHTIILKSISPNGTEIVAYFTDWEDCENLVVLIEHDRRF